MISEIEYLGNQNLLSQRKTAFLASSTIPPDKVLKCYDWAAGKYEGCVISGFSSKLEKDVLHFLLKSKCPIVMVLARKMYKELPEELKKPLAEGRLLIISTSKAPRQSKHTAFERNKYVCEQSDAIIFVGVTPKSCLNPLKESYSTKSVSIENV